MQLLQCHIVDRVLTTDDVPTPANDDTDGEPLQVQTVGGCTLTLQIRKGGGGMTVTDENGISAGSSTSTLARRTACCR